MSQETAGTIGIPVFRNEVLPALENFARRRERAAALQAARERQKQMMEYKRLSDLQKAGVTDMPATTGGLFDPELNDYRKAFITTSTEAAKKAQRGEITPGDLSTFVSTQKSQYEGIANKAKYQEKQIEEEGKRLRDVGINVSPGLVSQYGEWGRKNIPNFMDAPHAETFRQFALQNPANINPAKIAQVAMKDIPQEQLEIESGGKVEKLSYYPIFKVGAKKTSDGRDIIGATEVDIPSAEMVINRNPELKVAKDSWIKGTAAQLAYSPAYSQLPQIEREEKAVNDATKQFYDQFSSLYKTEKFGRRYEGGKGGASRSAGAYGKFRVGPAEIKTAQGAKVPVFEITGPSSSDVDIDIPQNTAFYNTYTGVKETLPDAGAKLLNPSIGYMAVDKKTGKEIDPKDWGRTNLNDVKFVPGVYGIKSALQPKGALQKAFELAISGGGGSVGQSGPSLTGDQIFIEEGIPGFKTLAGGILRAQGSSYENAKARALADTKRKFIQPGKAPAKRKFRTSK
jgi:hypothetical protein